MHMTTKLHNLIKSNYTKAFKALHRIHNFGQKALVLDKELNIKFQGPN
jgi:hypothetical protein